MDSQNSGDDSVKNVPEWGSGAKPPEPVGGQSKPGEISQPGGQAGKSALQGEVKVPEPDLGRTNVAMGKQDVNGRKLPPPPVPPPPVPASKPPDKPKSPLVEKPKGFRNFVILGLVAVAAIYGAVGYLYFQNRSLRNGDQDQGSGETQQPTPTPEFSPDQIKVKNGSIVRERPGGEVQVLVDKDNYESTGITGFAKVSISPDNAYICFEAVPPAPEPALYLAKVDGTEVAEVSPNREKCIWGPESSKIYYVNTSASESAVNIFSYNLADKQEANLTSQLVPEGIARRFEIGEFSADSSKLMCSYQDFEPVLNEEAVGETSGQCEIDLQTNQVSLL